MNTKEFEEFLLKKGFERVYFNKDLKDQTFGIGWDIYDDDVFFIVTGGKIHQVWEDEIDDRLEGLGF